MYKNIRIFLYKWEGTNVFTNHSVTEFGTVEAAVKMLSDERKLYTQCWLYQKGKVMQRARARVCVCVRVCVRACVRASTSNKDFNVLLMSYVLIFKKQTW